MKYHNVLLPLVNKEFYVGSEENSPIWTLRDGSKVRVCDMSTSHIRNSVGILNKKTGTQFRKWQAILLTELKKRDE